MRNVDTITKAWLNLALAAEDQKERAAENGAEMLAKISQLLHPILGLDLLNASIDQIETASQTIAARTAKDKLAAAQECGWTCAVITIDRAATPDRERRFLLPANQTNIENVLGRWIKYNVDGPYSIEFMRPSALEELRSDVDLAKAKIRELGAKVFFHYDKKVRLSTNLVCIPETTGTRIKDHLGNEIGTPANEHGYRTIPFQHLDSVFGEDSGTFVYFLAANTAKNLAWNLESNSHPSLDPLKNESAFITFDFDSVDAQIHIDPKQAAIEISFREDGPKPKANKGASPSL